MAHQKKTDERKEKKERLKKGTMKSRKSSKSSKIITVVFLIAFAVVIARGMVSFVDLKNQQNEVEEKYSSLLEQKTELEETLEYINTPEYIEKTARDMLKMVMPGEILYVLREPTAASKQGTTDTPASDKTENTEGN